MDIKKQDFEQWLDNPVTEAVMAAIADIRDKAMEDWNLVSWEDERMWRDGQAEYMRAACRSRAECAQDILNISFEEEDDTEHDRDTPD